MDWQQHLYKAAAQADEKPPVSARLTLGWRTAELTFAAVPYALECQTEIWRALFPGERGWHRFDFHRRSTPSCIVPDDRNV